MLRLLLLAGVAAGVAGFSAVVPSKTKWGGDFLDEKALLEQNAFAIGPDQLIELAKKWALDAKLQRHDPATLAEDFQFNFRYITLSKDRYLDAVKNFDLPGAFPDAEGRLYGFFVDPLETDRVWFIGRFKGTHTAKGGLPFEPTGKLVELGPQMNSLRFNEKGQVKEFTGGYIVDRNVGDAEDLGAIFGILYAIGKPFPFPEARPWKRSWRFSLFNKFGNLMARLRRKKKQE